MLGHGSPFFFDDFLNSTVAPLLGLDAGQLGKLKATADWTLGGVISLERQHAAVEKRPDGDEWIRVRSFSADGVKLTQELRTRLEHELGSSKGYAAFKMLEKHPVYSAFGATDRGLSIIDEDKNGYFFEEVLLGPTGKVGNSMKQRVQPKQVPFFERRYQHLFRESIR
jgi:hypothetical protein